jgi:hypothetical protein
MGELLVILSLWVKPVTWSDGRVTRDTVLLGFFCNKAGRKVTHDTLPSGLTCDKAGWESFSRYCPFSFNL